MAICVTAIAMPATPSAASSLPALKPNQPTQSIDAPTIGQHEAVWRHLCRGIAVPLAQDDTDDQGGDTGVNVDDRAPGEVEHPHRAEPAAAPHPVGDGCVDDS